MSVVNPMTALAFLEIARSGNHRSVLNTAAAGALGQMVDRLLSSAGIRVINILRRPAHVDEVAKHGADLVLDSSSPDFDAELRVVCKQEGARLAFDAVAGELTGRLLAAMPGEATVIVYGGLSEQPVRAEIGDLIFKGKTVTGFWLTRWLPQKNIVQSTRLWRRVQRLIGSELSSEIRSRYPLESVGEAVTDYESDMSSGKVMLTPAGGTD
jgi:NADPH:quinone reductase-like Zn-dependent oxidoreductase